MSWTSGDCDCGNTVDYGFYSSTHEDEYTEINIKVVCGACVRQRDNIPTEKVIDADFELFKLEVLKHGLRSTINWTAFVGMDSSWDLLECVCIMIEKNNELATANALIAAAWSVIQKNPSGQ